jgi:putative transposase
VYTTKQKQKALEIYKEVGSVTRTLQILGYPSRQGLYSWMKEGDSIKSQKKKTRGVNTPEHPRHPSYELKMEIIHRCFELGEDVKLVSEQTGYSRASIYTWRRKYIQEGRVALMNHRDLTRGKLKEGTTEETNKEIETLKTQIEDMKFEIDILKETNHVLKKDQDIDVIYLKNKEKTMIIDVLKKQYPLSKLLKRMVLSRSSYYYQQQVLKKKDKYKEIKKEMDKMFKENRECFGYRRIYGLLKRKGIIVSEKVVRHLMKELNLQVKQRKTKKYNSYQGEVTPAVGNLIERNFRADKPHQKLLTDITEFALPRGKVYLSPVIDCLDGMVITWKISTKPNAALVNNMLDDLLNQLREDEYPIIHTDCGCHYRWPGWIDRMEKRRLKRSMSKKGCSPDNAACEGFFGRLKNEMFYHQDWTETTIEGFIHDLNTYLHWYNRQRIKVSLGYMSPLEYRQSFGYA